ncbi:hypothetical protein AAFF_G00341690 [Aldrovandia affinis]|uniref:Uncharacterized protein n=1 Tax=Aldrovandia affinis TaxID=143900 RepID=A0AAD7WP97_9TELE|nr:hypothetical protein AAFF_G00341690 [Aldrovandia affinis]
MHIWHSPPPSAKNKALYAVRGNDDDTGEQRCDTLMFFLKAAVSSPQTPCESVNLTEGEPIKARKARRNGVILSGPSLLKCGGRTPPVSEACCLCCPNLFPPARLWATVAKVPAAKLLI